MRQLVNLSSELYRFLLYFFQLPQMRLGNLSILVIGSRRCLDKLSFGFVVESPLRNRFAMNRFLVSGPVSVDVAVAFLQPFPESGKAPTIYSGSGGALPALTLLHPIIPGLRQQGPFGAVQLDGG